MAIGLVESSSNQEQDPQRNATRSRLVQRLLGPTTSLPAFINDLLSTMAIVVAGTEAAGFLLERSAAPVEVEVEEDGEERAAQDPPKAQASQDRLVLRPIAHIRPDESDADTRAAAIRAFQELLMPCIQQNKDGAIEVGSPDGGEPQFCLVTLLRNEGQVVAAAAVITRCRDQERARQRLMSMQLVAGYFEMWMMRKAADQIKSVAQKHQKVLQLTTAVGTSEGFEAAAMNLCNELANRTGATRVALGWIKGERIRIKALSHTEKFDKKQELIVQIERAMEECLDQDEPIRFDFDGQRSENVTRAAEALSRAQGGNSVFSIPLRGKDDVHGVITLEFAPPLKLDEDQVDALLVSAEALSPSLKDRFDNDRWITTKLALSTREGLKMAVGAKYMLPKLIIILVIGLVLFVCLFKPLYHVSAPFTISAEGQQIISVPFDGFLEEVDVKPGDHVTKGQVLGRMKTDDLLAQKINAQSRLDQARAQYMKDIADRTKAGDAAVDLAEEAVAQTEIDRFNLQIKEATLRSPLDGVVMSEDITNKIGAKEQQATVLFEVAPPGSLRADLEVNERDIAEIKGPGQKGYLATSTFPGRYFDFRIERIIPKATPKEGDNSFTVYATIDNPASWMRPGLTGEAKVNTDHRTILWIWTHRLVEFIRLKLWM